MERSDVTGDGDLTGHRPGAAARRRAVELRRSRPVGTGVARVFGIHTQERAFRVGADGEELVARRLGKLGRDWHVLHAVPIGSRGSDIDHVVVGPAGVFTLNTKHHPGKSVWVSERSFMVEGQRTTYLRNSRFEADRAARLLSSACGFGVAVEPVIVVIAAKLTLRSAPSDVHVVAGKEIARWLTRRPTVLTPEGVGEIFGHARRASTWQTSTGAIR